jgi:hypothetical protein
LRVPRNPKATEWTIYTDAPAVDGEQVESDSLPAPPLAQIKPSKTEEKIPLISGQSAPDFGVSEVITFQLGEQGPATMPAGQGWAWDGRNWTISERPGSQRTRQFYLRVKDTAGKWRYAASTSLSFAEYNRRFTNKKFVVDRVYKATRKQAYEKFKEFCFETWRAQALRPDLTVDGSSASHI